MLQVKGENRVRHRAPGFERLAGHLVPECGESALDEAMLP